MVRHRSHSINFKRHVAQDYLSGETLHALARQYNVSRTLIRIWIEKYEAGDFDDETATADIVDGYEARIAVLERLVGGQALKIEFLKGALKHAPRMKSATTSVVTGPNAIKNSQQKASVSQKDVA